MNMVKSKDGGAITTLDEAHLNEIIDRRLDEMFEAKLNEVQENKTPSLAIISTKGTMDMAYPPFILASTATALGWDVSVFFTFYGLELLKKKPSLQVSPLGNPSMPMKMPYGPDWLKGIEWNIPNAVMSNVPGFEAMATAMFKETTCAKGVASVEELREATLEGGAKLYACQMTVDLFGHKQEDYIPEVEGWIGAATYLPMSQKADISLFI